MPVKPVVALSVVNAPVDGDTAPTDPLMLPVILPDTDRLVSVPTVVMLGCAAVCSVPVMPNDADSVAADTAPDAVTDAVLTDDADTVLATDRLVSVPTDVIFG